MKKWLTITIIILIVAIPIAYYLVSPIFRDIELNQESPIIKDSLDSMDAKTKEEFEGQVNFMKDKTIEMNDVMPSTPRIVSEAIFQPRAHDVKGRALLIEDNNNFIVRFEDFETINGPDLRIYLSSELGDSDFIELGKIKATKGNVNYNIPAGTDLTKYNKVLVWCKAFSVLFSYAEF